MSKKETNIVEVNLAREMIKAVNEDFNSGYHKAIISIDDIERLMHKYAESKVNDIVLADVSYSQVEKYAEFCIVCDRKQMSPLRFEDYLKLNCS